MTVSVCYHCLHCVALRIVVIASMMVFFPSPLFIREIREKCQTEERDRAQQKIAKSQSHIFIYGFIDVVKINRAHTQTRLKNGNDSFVRALDHFQSILSSRWLACFAYFDSPQEDFKPVKIIAYSRIRFTKFLHFNRTLLFPFHCIRFFMIWWTSSSSFDSIVSFFPFWRRFDLKRQLKCNFSCAPFYRMSHPCEQNALFQSIWKD